MTFIFKIVIYSNYIVEIPILVKLIILLLNENKNHKNDRFTCNFLLQSIS